MAKRGQQKDMKEILVGPGGGQYKGLSLAKVSGACLGLTSQQYACQSTYSTPGTAGFPIIS